MATLEARAARLLNLSARAQTIDVTSEPKTLQALNAWIATYSEWQLVRDPHGYYYGIHPTKAPTSGIYVHNLRGTTYAWWQRALAEATDLV